MAEKQPYRLIRPCAHCPFRTDVTAYLHPERVLEIERSLIRSEFPCHETTGSEDENGNRRAGEDEAHCAGALILLEKLERPSQMMRIAERIGMYDRKKLDLSAPVYDSFEEMYDACLEAEESLQPKRKTCRRKKSTKPKPSDSTAPNTRRRGTST